MTSSLHGFGLFQFFVIRSFFEVFVCFSSIQAQRVCTKIGQMWRAATLAGWQLYHDPNVDELGRGGSVQSVEGNQYRDVWKAACWKASEDVSSAF